MTDEHPNLLFGAYVLDSLSQAERRDVDLHLRDCPACAAELAELEPLRSLLASVDAADVEALDVAPSPDLFERMTAAIDAADAPSIEAHVVQEPRSGRRSRSGRRRPSRPRILVAAALAAVALAGAGIGAGVLASSDSSPRPAFSVAAGSVHMDARLESATAGTTLHVAVAGLPVNEHCTLIAVARDGSRHPAGQWVASYDGKAQITTATDVDRGQLQQLVLLGTNGQTLITMPVGTGK